MSSEGILNIATCQHQISADIGSNLKSILKHIKTAKKEGADIAHFPECSLSGYAGQEFPRIDPLSANELKHALERICKLAGKLGIWAIIGSHHFCDKMSRPYNSLFLINNKGELIDRYDKRLLFGQPGKYENMHYTPGSKSLVFKLNGIACGLLICHEWRYPELYREYYRLKARLLFQSWYDGNLSARRYFREGKELGELITGTVRGNAANNYMWISASNNSNRESSFPSFVVQPDGKILKKLRRNQAGVLISRIDISEVFQDPSAFNREKIESRHNS